MEKREFSAKTVDEAITKACIELELSSDQLEITVVSEGSSGFLGFGSKPAVISVSQKEDLKSEEKNSVAKEDEQRTEEKKEVQNEIPKAVLKEDSKEELKKEFKEDSKKNSKEKKQSKEIFKRTEEELEGFKKSAKTFLDQVFGAMELPVQITMEYEAETDSLNITFEGEDMGILIGKRGQTLDSLQYLVSLVVNKGQERFIRIKLDTEDYRRRRKETLENLAHNIARKVKKTRREVSLEPMNPYERRIIHSSLQNERFVETHSEGNEPYRHVVITPKH
jgi:spoIIIJ-associated protein